MAQVSGPKEFDDLVKARYAAIAKDGAILLVGRNQRLG